MEKKRTDRVAAWMIDTVDAALLAAIARQVSLGQASVLGRNTARAQSRMPRFQVGRCVEFPSRNH
jgi:hypothetical protein